MRPAVDPQGEFQLGPWHVYSSEGRLTDGEREERLEPKLLRILQLLVAADGEVLSRNALFEGVWPNQVIADQTLDSAISRLRNKLGDSPKSPDFILTVPKRGYRLLLPAMPVASDHDAATAAVLDAAAVKRSAPSFKGSGLTPTATRRRAGLLLAAALLAVIGFFFFIDRYTGRSAPAKQLVTEAVSTPADEAASVAVLPFVNMSDDPDTGYFSDGIAEELLNQLTRIDGLQVASRTSSFRFRQQAGSALPDLTDIARQLNVRYIIEGSVRRVEDDLRVTVQLIDGVDGFHRWSHTYEQRWEDIFGVQAAMTRDIVEQLAPKMLSTGSDKTGQHQTSSARAYEKYLLGRHYWHQRQPESLRKAVVYFEEALAIESDFALALTGLAETYLAMVPYGGMERSQALDRAEPLLARALLVAPELAESRLALGHLHFLRAEWAAAEAELRKSLALNRNLAMGHMLLGNVYNETGRLDEAYVSYREALNRDPLHATVLMNLAQASLKLGLYERARGDLASARQLFPAHTYLLGLNAHIDIAAGDSQAAEALLAQWQSAHLSGSTSPPSSDLLACGMLSVFLQRWQSAEVCLAEVLAAESDAWPQGSARMLALNHLAFVKTQQGLPDQARRLAGQAIAVFDRDQQALAHDEVAEYERAVAYALGGELDLSIQRLSRSIELGRRDYGWVRHDQRLATLSILPAFQSLLKQIETTQAELRNRVLQQFPTPPPKGDRLEK